MKKQTQKFAIIKGSVKDVSLVRESKTLLELHGLTFGEASVYSYTENGLEVQHYLDEIEVFSDRATAHNFLVIQEEIQNLAKSYDARPYQKEKRMSILPVLTFLLILITIIISIFYYI